MTVPLITTLHTKGRTLDLSTPKIMGILNVTPDSFSDGGKFNNPKAALKQASLMVKQGASIVDIGGESTRPGANAISLEEELNRTVPVVEVIAKELDVMISIDTSSPEVIEACVNAGAHLWNDIRALQRPHAVEMAKKLDVAVCLMHMQGDPKTMQKAPSYENVCKEVNDFLLQRAQVLLDAGISKDKIILDPGFGFGKGLMDNYQLLADLKRLVQQSGFIILSALSRKSMIGGVTKQTVAAERVSGSVAGALISVMNGAQIVRVHDVAETWQALQVFNIYKQAELLNSQQAF